MVPPQFKFKVITILHISVYNAGSADPPELESYCTTAVRAFAGDALTHSNRSRFTQQVVR